MTARRSIVNTVRHGKRGACARTKKYEARRGRGRARWNGDRLGTGTAGPPCHALSRAIWSRASRGNFALVWVQSKGGGLSDYALWTMQSSRLWPQLADAIQEQTGIDVCSASPAGCIFFSPSASWKIAPMRCGVCTTSPECSTSIVRSWTTRRSQKMLPQMGPRSSGKLLSRGRPRSTRCAFSMRLHLEFQHLRRRLSLPIIPSTRIEPGANEFRPAHRQRARSLLHKVVLAAGLGNARLAPMLALHAPVRPQRGQIMVTEKVAPFLPYVVHTVRQTDEGGVMISNSVEEAGYDPSVGSEILSSWRVARCGCFRSWGGSMSCGAGRHCG